MKIKETKAVLAWLIIYMQKNNPKELEQMKKARKWLALDSMDAKTWVSFHAKTKALVMEAIEVLLREMKMLSFEDRSDSNELRKPALQALVNLMGIEDLKIFRKDLEDKILGFVKEASA